MSRSREYEEYIKSPAWRRTSEVIKKRSGYVCKRCGYAGWNVEVHHLNYERLGRELFSDLEVLCKPCHKAADKERECLNRVDYEELRRDSAYMTYMHKKYGDHWGDNDCEQSREEFDEWLADKEEHDSYGY